MKLLFCPNCSDVFKLSGEIRSCKCGMCRGKYHDDYHRAVVNGKGMSIGIDNQTMHMAYSELMFGPVSTPRIVCWARPHLGVDNPNTEVDEDL
jgi:hypothetical protein